MLGTGWHPNGLDDLAQARDLSAMRAMGLSGVRLQDTAWSPFEPTQGDFDFRALDRRLDALAAHGLRAVLVLPLGRGSQGRFETAASSETGGAEGLSPPARCLSAASWLEASEARIRALAAHAGTRVEAFSLDASRISRCTCAACVAAFFADPTAAHEGTRGGDPTSGGTGSWQDAAAPAALRMAWRRFHSARAAEFARRVRRTLTEHAPNAPLRLYLGEGGANTDLFAVADAADGGVEGAVRPLPFSARLWPDADPRAGHPDAAAFLHDLLRGAGRGRFHVAAQQCGLIDDGARRAAPAPGMVRLWTWEALAHGAESVTFSRWRESAREAGLVHVDGEADQGFAEAARVAREMEFLRCGPSTPASVALMVDAEAAWAFEIEPWGVPDAWLRLTFTFYAALRQLGLDVDVVPSSQALPPHGLVVAPTLPVWRLPRRGFLRPSQALVLGPRTATRTAGLDVDREGVGEGRARMRPLRGESVPDGPLEEVAWEGRRYAVGPWREWMAADTVPVARFADGEGAVHEADSVHRIGFWPSVGFLVDYLETVCARQGINTWRLPPGLRLRRCGDLTFAVNASASQVAVPAPHDAAFFLGSRDVSGRSVTAWRPPS